MQLCIDFHNNSRESMYAKLSCFNTIHFEIVYIKKLFK